MGSVGENERASADGRINETATEPKYIVTKPGNNSRCSRYHPDHDVKGQRKTKFFFFWKGDLSCLWISHGKKEVLTLSN
jgi:hypothetical protein